MVHHVRTTGLFDVELALDRIDARLAAELPAHVAALAHAHADGTVAPSTIAITPREVDAVIAARGIVELRAHATRLLRVIAPMVIESAPSVVAAGLRERTWENYRSLAAARDEQARMRFVHSHRALVHELAGVPVGATRDDARIPPRVDGWLDARCDVVTDAGIAHVWAALRGADFGTLEVLRSATAHPRTFVVERGVRAILVVPTRIDTPAARFAALHELGHAALWLAPLSMQHEWPRALDEAAASYVARSMEHDADGLWFDPLARRARERRLAIARALDAIEAGAPHGELERPPWALWHDPYAQAAYVEAEQIADEMPAGLRGDAIAEWLSRSR